MLKKGLVLIWELHMNLVPTLMHTEYITQTKGGDAKFGATFASPPLTLKTLSSVALICQKSHGEVSRTC